MPHDHHHHHALPETGDRRVLWAVMVNIALTVAQIVAGVFSGSLAMIADAIHNLSDALSLVIAFVARRIARRPADADMTFGYGRAEVVAALVNYTTLIVIALYLVAEGIGRLFNPVEIEGWIVVMVAGIAFVVDAVTALLIMRLSRDSVNMRAAFLHNLADALGSVAVIVAGVLIILYDWRLIDPILTLLIAAYILWHSIIGLRPVIRILMLASPDDPPLEDVLRALEAMPGVDSIHHVHLWRMQEHEISLDSHVVLDGTIAADDLRRSLRQMLTDRFGIHHGMIEMETPENRCPDPARIGH
ncbi:MAG: cation diffusion facilitator family transporter [Rhodobacteraceae bacterium]|nr:cation diffusion facilitator family transporter [Paracoccaceae bacterium]MCW9043321.1 cation diffusion facilitator family transporter [Pseudopelagicola sp.]